MAFDGKALSYSFNDPKAKDSRTVQYYELFGNRVIYAELFINDKSVGKTHIAKPYRSPIRSRKPSTLVKILDRPGYLG